MTVEQLLVGPMQLSRRMIQRLTRGRGITLNGRAPFLGRKAREGDVVAARVEWAEESGLVPVAMDLVVVYEDGDLLVVDKPPFQLVHPTAPQHVSTLAHGVAHHLLAQGVRTKVRPVHRIDRDTSGLVLFARNPAAHHRLDLQLRDHTLRREYVALIEGRLPDESGEITAPIGRHATDPQLRAVRAGGEPALTRYRVVERFPEATLIAAELETGRTHQIRVHLSHLGHPLVGDRQYGARSANLLRRQALHSSVLSFLRPSTGDRLTVEAELPADLAELLTRLRG